MQLEISLRLRRRLLQPNTLLPIPPNPLFAAVVANNLDKLINLVEAGNSINVHNTKGSSLLNVVMRLKRVEMFDFLLTRPELDVNFLDKLEQSPLLYLVRACFNEYFALELLKKGADIHQRDSSEFTVLHLAAKSNETLRFGRLLIEKGGDVNARGHYGITPLYIACEAGNFEWICMLLYHGADTTICNDRGVLPLAVISRKLQPEEILHLFYYTFDEHLTTVNLSTAAAAMTHDSPLFSMILQHVTEIRCNSLTYFVNSLINIQTDNLKMFLDKFGYITEELFSNFPFLDTLVHLTSCYGVQKLKEIVKIFLESDYVEGFVQSVQFFSTSISALYEVFTAQDDSDDSLTEEEFTEMVCIMLSYGFPVTSKDLDTVYNNYGYCELFKILLHMDFVILKTDAPSMAQFYYNPHLSRGEVTLTTGICADLVGFYNQSWIKKFVLTSEDEELIERVKMLPEVPFLLELSRDAARKFIVNRFNIQSSMHFYTVLQRLPVGEMNRVILALERKLYQ